MKKKILFITHSDAMTGGAEDEFERLLKHFSGKKDQYEVHGLFPKGDRAVIYSKYCERYGYYKYGHLPVIYENITDYIKYVLKSVIQIFQIIRFASGQKYDLTVINVVVLIWPALGMRILGSKVIVFIREDIYPIKIRHFVYKLLSNFCSYFIPNSITKEKDFITTTGDTRINHIYPAIEDSLNIERTELNKILEPEVFSKLVDKTKFKFVNPARILKKKNQLLILKALNCLKKINKVEMPLVFFVGYYDISTAYMKTLTEYIKLNSLQNYCFFLGELERQYLYAIYQFVNSTILTSLSEGMPIVLVESFKFQKPVISTKVGGIPEIINDSVNGFLIDFDENQLSNSMTRLIHDKKLYNDIRKNAFVTYQENFNLNNILNETESIFQKIMNN